MVNDNSHSRQGDSRRKFQGGLEPWPIGRIYQYANMAFRHAFAMASNTSQQKAQLSQRDRSMLHAIEYFA